jgi:signal peptidase
MNMAFAPSTRQTHALPGQRDRGAGRTALRWVGTLGLALVVGFAALMLLAPAFGYQRYVITGGSMTGSIDKGSVVFDKVVPVAQLRAGDVITFTPPPSSGVHHRVTHRITFISHDPGGRPVFHTKGDANRAPDPWKFTLNQSTQPRASFHVPYVGYVLVGLSDRHIRTFLIGGPALAIAFLVLVTMWRQAGEDAAETKRTPRPTPKELAE